MKGFDITEKPFIVFWEVTRACMLACKHCRAKAQRKRHPDELSTEEAKDVVDQLREFKKPYPLLVLTGGDPLMREDIFELISYATESGFRTAIAFSGTELATEERLKRLKDSGIARIAISIDGSTPEIHDSFRGIAGTFQQSVEILEKAVDLGISSQINTTVSAYNLRDLPGIMRLCMKYGVSLWDVFFIVPTGRARADIMPSSQEFEDVLNWLYDVSRSLQLNVKSSAATHFRRIEYQRDRDEYSLPRGDLYGYLYRHIESGDGKGEIISGYSHRSLARDGIKRAMGITDGRGMFFISHVGEVYPSGFLPIKAGNVRRDTLKDIYTKSNLFLELKNPDLLKGKCGRCEFRYICGGSRARAYAMTGDYLSAEPRCIYKPSGDVISV